MDLSVQGYPDPTRDGGDMRDRRSILAIVDWLLRNFFCLAIYQDVPPPVTPFTRQFGSTR